MGWSLAPRIPFPLSTANYLAPVWSAMQLPDPDKSTTALPDALRWLLRPLVRLLIEKGITFPQLRDMLKSIYVEVADESFNLSEAPTSDSRIFVLTGIHRKDIKRLRHNNETTGPDNNSSPTLSLGGYLVSRWISDPRFLDQKGDPISLPRSTHDNRQVLTNWWKVSPRMCGPGLSLRNGNDSVL